MAYPKKFYYSCSSQFDTDVSAGREGALLHPLTQGSRLSGAHALLSSGAWASSTNALLSISRLEKRRRMSNSDSTELLQSGGDTHHLCLHSPAENWSPKPMPGRREPGYWCRIVRCLHTHTPAMESSGRYKPVCFRVRTSCSPACIIIRGELLLQSQPSPTKSHQAEAKSGLGKFLPLSRSYLD